MLKFLLLLMLVGCSVAKDEDLNNTPDQATQEQKDSAITGNNQGASRIKDNDIDGDYIPDDIEESLGLSAKTPDVPVFKVDVDKIEVFEGNLNIFNLTKSKENFLEDYVKLLSLGRGESSNFNFINRSTVLGVNITSPKYSLNEFSECSDKCSLRLSVGLDIKDSVYFKNYENFEITVQYYNKLTHDLIPLDTRVVVDGMNKPISVNLKQDSGSFFKKSNYDIEIQRDFYRGVRRGDYLILVGLTNFSIENEGSVITLQDIDIALGESNKRVVLHANGKVYNYISPDEEYLKELVFNPELHEIKFNGLDIYSVNDLANNMSKWSKVLDIQEKNYLNGLWKVSQSGFNENLIENNNYFISYVTNLDRLKLAPKSYVVSDVTISKLSDFSLKPYESISLMLSKNFTRFKEEDYSEDFSTRIAYIGGDACFRKDWVTNNSCCGGPRDIKSLQTDTSTYGCCGRYHVCVDSGKTVNVKEYTCTINKVKVSSYVDDSAFESFENLSLKVDKQNEVIDSFFIHGKSINNKSVLLMRENSSLNDLKKVSLSTTNRTQSLRNGYTGDGCLRSTCTQFQRWKGDCIEKQPSREAAKSENKTDILNLNITLTKKTITEPR